MDESIAVYRRRRALALAAVVCVVVAGVLALRSCDDDSASPDQDATAQAPASGSQTATTPSSSELPRGGRRIFPDHRVVAFYGAPQDEALGVLGIGTPNQAAAKLERVARGYARKTRPVLPAFELLATIATAAPGDDGLHRSRQSDAVIARYLAAARRTKALLVLDIQPGRGTFLDEAKRLEKWLLQPDVGIALDPEWHVGLDEVPGKVIGSVTAAEINAVSSYVSAFVTDHDLPDKLFVIHQFTGDMIGGRERIARRLGLAVTMNVDGFGNRADKVSKYDQFTSELPRFDTGFKLFYEEDTDLMTPSQVLALSPPPDLVVYE